MSSEPNPYAPPPTPDPLRTRSPVFERRPGEPPFASHTVTLPGRPATQGTLVFYADRLHVERSEGEIVASLSHDDFIRGDAKFIVGGLIGGVIVLHRPTRMPLRLSPEALQAFRVWIQPRLSDFRASNMRERSRLGGLMGAAVIALSVPPLMPAIVWTGVVSGSALLTVTIGGRVIKGRAAFLIVAAAWLVLAANNVARTIDRGSPAWLVLSVLWVVIAMGAVHSFRFFAPIATRADR